VLRRQDDHTCTIRTNRNTRDREGRLISCEHDARRVTRTEPDGTITVLLDNYEGKKLNAPNDVVVASGCVPPSNPITPISPAAQEPRRSIGSTTPSATNCGSRSRNSAMPQNLSQPFSRPNRPNIDGLQRSMQQSDPGLPGALNDIAVHEKISLEVLGEQSAASPKLLRDRA
jgi:hypothetical protein